MEIVFFEHYAVSGRQVYHAQMRMQIINHMYHIEHFLLPHMNSSLKGVVSSVIFSFAFISDIPLFTFISSLQSSSRL